MFTPSAPSQFMPPLSPPQLGPIQPLMRYPQPHQNQYPLSSVGSTSYALPPAVGSSSTPAGYGYAAMTNPMAPTGHPMTPVQQIASSANHQISPTPQISPGHALLYAPERHIGDSPPMMRNAAFQFPSMTHEIRVTPDSLGQTAPPGIKPRATTTLWEDEGTLCFQVEAKGICVARRTDNNMINGTKLLNVAGLTRGRRDGILKTEKVRHVVKIGTMFLKGVWIPYERALEFAAREKIVDMLYPLFVADIRTFLYHPVNYTRTLQVLAAAQRKRAVDQQMQLQAQQKQYSQAPLFPPPPDNQMYSWNNMQQRPPPELLPAVGPHGSGNVSYTGMGTAPSIGPIPRHKPPSPAP